MVFDGRKFASDLEKSTAKCITSLSKSLKLASIYDQASPGAVRYTEIKERKAKELGVEFEKYNEIDAGLIEKLNRDPGVNGIMIQLPFANSEELIKLIGPKKDVDGLREDSPYKAAVVRAVREIVGEVEGRVVVVGSKGFVGRKLMQEFPTAVGMDKDDFDPSALLRADVVISATGQAGLIKPEMVKDGVVAIDLGYPRGDFDPSTALRASLFTPVPGGVGPVTVAMLYKNLLDSVNGIR